MRGGALSQLGAARLGFLLTLAFGLGETTASAQRPGSEPAAEVFCLSAPRGRFLAALPALIAGNELPPLACADRIFRDYRSETDALRAAYLRMLVRLAPQATQPFLPQAAFSEEELDQMGRILARYDRMRFPGRYALYQRLCEGRVPNSGELTAQCARHRAGGSLLALLRGSDLQIDSLTDDERESMAADLRAVWQHDGPLWERRSLRRGLCVTHRPRTRELATACAAIPPEQADLPAWNTRALAREVRRAESEQREEEASQLWLGVVLSAVAALVLSLVTLRERSLETERELRRSRWAAIPRGRRYLGSSLGATRQTTAMPMPT